MCKSTSDPILYVDFHELLEHEIDEIVSKIQGLFTACCKYDRLIAFSVSFNRLEPLKPPVTKL